MANSYWNRFRSPEELIQDFLLKAHELGLCTESCQFCKYQEETKDD